ncbi:unnamed protein product [Caenorhabditis angaria]|uniref:C-type lectin domain-containing protein n=1 Tax=Caenorhabditis angaria TaxID=860376 RepID=A0A9P1IU32_9PELO|nr:unnamed protein product [Caenorhabditis angaria]
MSISSEKSDIELQPFEAVDVLGKNEKDSDRPKALLLLLAILLIVIFSVYFIFVNLRYFGIKVEKECPTNWTSLNRTMGEWCVQVFFGNINLAEAQQICSNNSAVISSIENTDELQLFSKMAQVSHKNYIYVGARRTEKCMNSKLSDVCTKETSFEWTDGFTKGVEGFQWEDTQPDNHLGDQKCVVLGVKTSLLDDERESAMRGGVICGARPN